MSAALVGCFGIVCVTACRLGISSCCDLKGAQNWRRACTRSQAPYLIEQRTKIYVVCSLGFYIRPVTTYLPILNSDITNQDSKPSSKMQYPLVFQIRGEPIPPTPTLPSQIKQEAQDTTNLLLLLSRMPPDWLCPYLRYHLLLLCILCITYNRFTLYHCCMENIWAQDLDSTAQEPQFLCRPWWQTKLVLSIYIWSISLNFLPVHVSYLNAS